MFHGNNRINFLGKPQCLFSGEDYKVKSNRVFALLASAQIHNKPLSRCQIQRYLWLQDEGLDDSVYAGRLRVLLYSNKTIIEKFLDVDALSISFKEQCGEEQYLSDIQEFNALIKHGSMSSLKEAVHLYKGEFMQGFKMRGIAFEFEDLLLQQRAYWQEEVIATLDKIVNRLLTGRRKADLSESLYYVQKSLSINPFRDESQIQLAKIYCQNRQQKQAINQLENYIRRLKQSLSTNAGTEVHSLLNQLRNHQLPEDQDYSVLQLREIPKFRSVQF